MFKALLLNALFPFTLLGTGDEILPGNLKIEYEEIFFQERNYVMNIYLSEIDLLSTNGKTFQELWDESEKKHFWMIRTETIGSKITDKRSFSFYEATSFLEKLPSKSLQNCSELSQTLNIIMSGFSQEETTYPILGTKYSSPLIDPRTEQQIIRMELYRLERGVGTAKLILESSRKKNIPCQWCEIT